MQGSDVALFARIRGKDGQLITAESISSISYQVSNLTTGQVAGSGTFAPTDVIFDNLQQQDPRWSLDSASRLGKDGAWGYNFAATILASDFAPSTLAAPALTPAPTSMFQIDVVFVPVSGSRFTVSWQAPAIPVYV